MAWKTFHRNDSDDTRIYFLVCIHQSNVSINFTFWPNLLRMRNHEEGVKMYNKSTTPSKL